VVLQLACALGALDGETELALQRQLSEVAVPPLDTRAFLLKAFELGRRLDQALALTGQVVVEYDAAGRVTGASGPVDALLGRPAFRLVGCPLEEVAPGLTRWRAGRWAEMEVTVGQRALLARLRPFRGPETPPAAGGLVSLAPFSRTHPLCDRERRKGGAGCTTLEDLVGSSPKLARVRELAARVAASDLPVLLIGESGTGKEILAKAIHNLSRRSNGPFIPINCAAIPESLIESELFGYEGGAFTGAEKGGKPSLFERAHGGTVLLDEVGDMTAHAQVALLRVLEERAVTRVGGTRTVPVDVRVIAATNRDLEDLLADGTFRRDLYHRLCVLPVTLPALRERPEDVPELAGFFLDELGTHRGVPREVMEYLQRYRWPGNIRELRHCIEYMSTVSAGPLTVQDLPPHIVPHVALRGAEAAAEDARPEAPTAAGAGVGGPGWDAWDHFILKALADSHAAGRGLGRRALVEQARLAGLGLTENAVRARLRALRERGVLQWRTGRGGARLTARGRRLLGLDPDDTACWTGVD
jgi:transcriptional regulator with PAS, ATPase and Fis domain